MQKDEALFSQVDMLRFYDEVLVPAIFSPWAELLLDQLEVREGMRVLDLATGPGTVAQAVAKRAEGEVSVTGADISQTMLEIARKKLPGMEFIETPASPLRLPSEEFDLVACQQGLQYFSDRMGALREIRRVLRSGGKFALAVWGPIRSSLQFNIYKEAMVMAGAPVEALRVVELPFSWPKLSEAKELVANSGLIIEKAVTMRTNSIYKGGTAQLISAAKAAPFGPHLTAMDQRSQNIFESEVIRLSEKHRVRSHFVFPMESNIIIGRK